MVKEEQKEEIEIEEKEDKMTEETKIVEKEKDVKVVESAKVRIYGIPLEFVHDKGLGPILEGREDYPFFGILYCGFKTVINEVRQPTQRLFYFKKEHVENTGVVKDFEVEEHIAHYYEMPLQTEIYEKQFERVAIGEEISAKPRIFASRVMVNPKGGVDISEIKNMKREVLEDLVASLIEGRTKAAGGGFETMLTADCENYCKSYTKTRHDPYTISDYDGGECD
jgi:hypothetical protein